MFTQALIRRRRALIDLKAYGTDNEDALCNAFRITFANLIGLLCRIHKKENIEHHLHSTMKVSPYTKREIMHDAKSSWPDFIDKLRQRAEVQIRQEDKALYGSGEYRLDKCFQFLELEP